MWFSCAFLKTYGNKVTLPGDASYASLLTNRLSQATVGCLLLAYSFSPRVHSIPRGPLTLKSQNFDEITGFLTGSCEGAYFAVRN